MNVNQEINQKIKHMMMSSCNIARKVPFEVNDYKEVLDLWKIYKMGGNLYINENPELKNIFQFHESMVDHVILFWSLNHKNCILLCRVDGEIVNSFLPMQLDKEYSFIATYT